MRMHRPKDPIKRLLIPYAANERYRQPRKGWFPHQMIFGENRKIVTYYVPPRVEQKIREIHAKQRFKKGDLGTKIANLPDTINSLRIRDDPNNTYRNSR